MIGNVRAERATQESTALRLRRCASLCAVWIFASHGLAGQVGAGLATPLTPGTRLERELIPKAVHAYTVELEAGGALRGVVEQQGVDLLVRIFGPDGRLISAIDSPNGDSGPEPIVLDAAASGAHRIEIAALDASAARGHYAVHVQRVMSAAERGAEIALDRERRTAAVDWLREHSHPIADDAPRTGLADLAPLRSLIGDARVVALGEATHGTREFFRLKHRFFEYLVTELGFTAFAFEAPLAEALDVDRWIVDGAGDPALALASLYFWTWNTEEVMDLLEWMREWNADPAHARKLRFYGLDAQFPALAGRLSLIELGDVDPPTAVALEPKLARALSAFQSGLLSTLPADEKAAIVRAARELESALVARESALLERGGRDRASRTLRLARNFVQSIEVRTRDNVRASELCDAAMAENAVWALGEEGAGGKLAIWAHNAHVSMREASGFRPMGRHLKDALGDVYRSIGFGFHEGAFQAMGAASGLRSGVTSFAVGPAPVESVESALADAGAAISLVDLRALPRDGRAGEWFAPLHPMREIGSSFAPELAHAAIVERRIAEHWDTFAFVRRTTASRAMPAGSIRASPIRARPIALDFEQGDEGTLPFGWRPGRFTALGHELGLTRDSALNGAQSLSIRSLGGVRYGAAAAQAEQRFASTPWKGRSVRVCAKSRISGSMRAFLAVAVDADGSGGAGAPTWSEVPRTKPFATVSVDVALPESTTFIEVRLVAEGDGRAWFDDVSIEAVP